MTIKTLFTYVVKKLGILVIKIITMVMKMMKFMPVIFTVFCYSFSCALSLYSTINGLFTIIQQIVINRSSDDVPAPAVTVAGGKTVKNVTPSKKKLK